MGVKYNNSVKGVVINVGNTKPQSTSKPVSSKVVVNTPEPVETKPQAKPKGKKKDMKNKGVSFNVIDPFQADVYDWACGLSNFSNTVKRLLAEEMAKQKRQDKGLS